MKPLSRLATLLSGLLLAGIPAAAQGIITTFAGTSATFLGDGRPAVAAPLGRVAAVATDGAGNFYLADSSSYLVMRVAPDGILTVVAGNGFRGHSGDGGRATSARLEAIVDLGMDGAGNLYIASTGNVRKVGTDGIITTVAGNPTSRKYDDGIPATEAEMNITGLAVDFAGVLYIADVTNSNHRIRRAASDGLITTIAGSGRGFSGDGGPARNAQFAGPGGMAVDAAGNLFVPDRNNNRIRRIGPDGNITTVAGNGRQAFSGDGAPAVSASIALPKAVAVDRAGNLYIVDEGNGRIRRVDRAGIMSTYAGRGSYGFAGDGGPATNALLNLNFYGDAAADGAGNLYIADAANYRVRGVTPGGLIRTVAGIGEFGFFGDNEAATTASLDGAAEIALDPASSVLYIADGRHYRLRQVKDGIISTLSGNGQVDGTPSRVGDGVPAKDQPLNEVSGVAADRFGSLYFAEYSSPNRLRRISPAGIVSTVATACRALSLAIDNEGNLLLPCSDNRVRRVTPAGTVSVVAGTGTSGFSGDGGPATSANLSGPAAVAVDPAGNVYIGDSSNFRVRRVGRDGIISTVAGGGSGFGPGDGGPATSAVLRSVDGLAVDRSGNLYIAERLGGRVRRVSPDGVIITFAGGARSGSGLGDGGPATAALLSFPEGLAVDPAGNLYIADAGNGRIRKVLAEPPSFSVSPGPISFSAEADGPVTSPRRIRVTGSVFGLPFVATPNAAWLQVTPAAGTAPAVLELTADPSGITPGNYEASLAILAPGASPPERSVPVQLEVSAASPAALAAEPARLSFSLTPQSAPVTEVVTIANRGGGEAVFQASASTARGGSWLAVSPAEGRVRPRGPVPLQVSVRPDGLRPGTYSGQIEIAAQGAQVVVPVIVSVSATRYSILVSQAGLSFTAVAGAAAEPSQSFGVLNTGEGVMRWSARARGISGGDGWLSVSPASGSTDASSLTVPLVDVSINPAGLAPGEYHGRVAVHAEGAPNSPQYVSVVLQVLPAVSVLPPIVRPTGLIFAAASRDAVSGSQDVTVANITGAPQTFTSGRLTSDGKNSFVHLPTDATVASGQRLRIIVQPDFSVLEPGIQRGAITLLFQDGTVRHVNLLLVLAGGARAAAASASGPPFAETGCQPARLLPLFTRLGADFRAAVSWPVALEARIVDDCGSAMISGSVVVTFSSGEPPISLVSLKDGTWAGTWQPRAEAAQVTLKLAAETPAGIRGTAQIGGSLAGSGTPPVIEPGQLLSAASRAGDQPLAPGSLISILGRRLAEAAITSDSLPLGVRLGTTTATIAGLPMPLLAVREERIDAMVPYGVPVNARQQVVVTRGVSSALPEPVHIADAQPAIFTVDGSGAGQGWIEAVREDDSASLADAERPAAAGSAVLIYCAGLGEVDPPVAAGAPAPESPSSAPVNPVTVSIGGVEAEVVSATLVPGRAGVYVVRALVPPDLTPAPDVPVVVTAAGQRSNSVTMATR